MVNVLSWRSRAVRCLRLCAASQQARYLSQYHGTVTTCFSAIESLPNRLSNRKRKGIYKWGYVFIGRSACDDEDKSNDYSAPGAAQDIPNGELERTRMKCFSEVNDKE